jgi:hypothetical protein
MTVLYNYGATGLESYLESGVNKATIFQRAMNPNEECLFYIGVLSYWPIIAPSKALQSRGGIRTGLALKGEGLFYSVIPQLDSSLIPCGKMVFRN